ncbi:MAG: DUF4142 domain-containing protein [Sphingomonadales bacterium]|nr:DUF4142 domain-containing protein [Sphingomonadales bacterium]
MKAIVEMPLAAAVLALALGGCNQRTAENVDDTSNATTQMLASIGNSALNAADTMKDALERTPTGQEFANRAARSDAFEIAAAKLAGVDAAARKVKAFAREMVAAHARSTAAIKAAAARATPVITPDPTLTDDQMEKLADLGRLKGAAFDRAYMTGQIDAHERARSLIEDYARHGEVASLKEAAGTIAPIVKKHLAHAKALRDELPPATAPGA